MMASLVNALGFVEVAILSILIIPSESLVCYKCLEANKYCRDPFTHFDADIPDCDGFSCSKSSYQNKGESVVERGCTAFHNTTGCTTTKKDGIAIEVCICNTDYCNDSTSVFSSGNMRYAFVVAVNLVVYLNSCGVH